MERTPTTLLEAVTHFADRDRAHAYAVQMRWPNGIACPRMGCGSADVQAIATRKIWRCKECKRQFSVRVGTIFEDSPLPLTKWLPAFWLLANTKNGTSSCELARAIGVTQKTAWFMLHRIREAMGAPSFQEKMQGHVEVDETYVGGKVTNKRGNRGARVQTGYKRTAAPKTVVMGMIERGGKVRAKVVPDARRSTLLPAIRENVRGGSTVYTDAWAAYIGLDYSYNHLVIDHAYRYVEGHVHTNSIENLLVVPQADARGHLHRRPAVPP